MTFKEELKIVDRERSKAMEIEYRRARPEDVPEMADLFLEAVGNLYARNNVTAALPPRPGVLLGYEHVRSTGVFHVAELDGQIVAVAGAIFREHLWFLSAFWARPAVQRQGIGMPLLRRVWEAGVEAGTKIFYTWSSVDPTAMAAYMKLGMLPGYQILFFEGVPQRLPPVPSAYEVAVLDKPQAMDVDYDVLGTRRRADHDFWCDRLGLPGRQVSRNGEVRGYYYLGQGSIGPVAWRQPQDSEAVLALACQEAAVVAPRIRISVPGVNYAAVRFAFDSGLRLTGFAHLLRTAAFGQMEQYLPSGPSLF